MAGAISRTISPPFPARTGQRADLAKADLAAGVDDIGLGHAVYPEIDSGSALAVDADTTKGVAKTSEEPARILRLVLVGHPFQGDIRTA